MLIRLTETYLDEVEGQEELGWFRQAPGGIAIHTDRITFIRKPDKYIEKCRIYFIGFTDYITVEESFDEICRMIEGEKLSGEIRREEK